MTDEPKPKENDKEEAAPAAPEASPAAVKKEEKKKEAAPAVVVKGGKGSRPKQCSECKKNLKKKTWYYRSNQYFCNKNCWKTSQKKAPKAPAAA